MSYINDWKQQGIISLWRYHYPDDIDYPNWHFTADNIGCHSLILLLNAFEKEHKEVEKKIIITPPNKAILDVPNNRVGVAECVSPKELLLSFSTKSDDWFFNADTDHTHLVIGKRWISEFKWVIDGVMTGESNDWIGKNDGREELLWYWRYPKPINI